MTFQRLDPLPEGVRVVREYRSLGCFLVECDHDVAAQVRIMGGAVFCRVCRSVTPIRPVKMLAILPEAQHALF